MRQACQMYGIKAISFAFIDKNCGHPTIQGMQGIKDTILSVLTRKMNKECSEL